MRRRESMQRPSACDRQQAVARAQQQQQRQSSEIKMRAKLQERSLLTMMSPRYLTRYAYICSRARGGQSAERRTRVQTPKRAVVRAAADRIQTL